MGELSIYLMSSFLLKCNAKKRYCNVVWFVSDIAVLLGAFCNILYFVVMYCILTSFVVL